MIARLLAAALLVAAAACSREAPVENKPATAAVVAPQPSPAPATNTINAAAIAPLPDLPKPAEAEAPVPQAEPEEEPAAREDEEVAEAPEEEEAPPPLRGCAREIGERRAQRLARQCIMVSTASRPPCNVENSCALIRSEIERGCSMSGEDAPGFCR